jgi:hypothetical protein
LGAKCWLPLAWILKPPNSYVLCIGEAVCFPCGVNDFSLLCILLSLGNFWKNRHLTTIKFLSGKLQWILSVVYNDDVIYFG